MRFIIPSETYVRLAVAAGVDHLACVRIEHLDGQSLAVATNRKILACQNLGPTSEPDGAVNVTIEPTLLAAAQSMLDDELIVTALPGVDWSTAAVGSYSYPGNAMLSDYVYREKWPDWRTFIPETLPAKSGGFMYMDTDLLSKLGRTSPSGRFTFPKVINALQPILVRDAIDPSWFGLFLGYNQDGNRALTAATIPEWFTL